MEDHRASEYLMHFGLSRQEAIVYERLLSGGKQTGYEIARGTGISRSNAYTSLAALVEKGAAYLTLDRVFEKIYPGPSGGILREQDPQDGGRKTLAVSESAPRGIRRRRIYHSGWRRQHPGQDLLSSGER